jgi:antitoxin PrlF
MGKYTGSITTSGKSEAIRFEKGLFRQNPEFRQQAKVEAQIIGPGLMLVSVVNEFGNELIANDDPIVMAFLTFLEKDIKDHPDRLSMVSEDSIAHAIELTKDVAVADDDILDENVTI